MNWARKQSRQDAKTNFAIFIYFANGSAPVPFFSTHQEQSSGRPAAIVRQLQKEDTQQQHELRCLACIRQVSSIGLQGDLTKQKCDGYYCGPFQISYQYWAEAGKPRTASTSTGRDFEKCARDNECAEQTVRAYFKKFKRDCNNDGRIDCLDMAALHRGGPTSCASDWFYKSRFWQAFNKSSCAGPNHDSSDDLDWLASRRSDSDKQNEESNKVVMKNQTLTSECLDCICEALTSCGAQTTSTHNCGTGDYCGPFAISQAYWKEGRRPGASWTACARTRECSVVTIRNYMEKHKRDCNGDGFITCDDYAAIHRRGPKSCTNRDILRESYWQKFLSCRANQKQLSNDVNMVKVGGETGASSAAPQSSAASESLASTLPSTVGSTFSTQQEPELQQTVHTVQTKPVTSETQSEPLRGVQYQLAAAHSTNYELSPMNEAHEQAPTLDTGAPGYQMHQSVASTRTQPKNQASTLLTTTFSTSTTASVTHEALPTSSGKDSSTAQRPNLSNQRPTVDYNQLPTIIVSKPLGAASTQWVSSAVPSSQSLGAVTPPTFSIAEQQQQNNPTRQKSSFKHEHQPSLSATETTDNDSIIDYSIPEPFPFASVSGSASNVEIVHDAVDRTNFDRVVNGIVANPDFSKSYPPTPSSDASSGSQARRKSSSGPAPGQDMLSTDQRPAQRSRVGTGTLAQFQQQQQAPQRQISQQQQHQQHSSSPGATITNRQALNKKDLQLSRATPAANHAGHNDNQAAHNHSGPLSMVGPDTASMSNLFELGLNESSRIASDCLDCICDASSNCDTTVQCISKQRDKNRCGLYMISWNQYKDSDISLTLLTAPSSLTDVVSSSSTTTTTTTSITNEDHDEKLYYECSTDKSCAEKLIHLYIEKHQKDCNNDGKIDCLDIAAIHRVGPDLCNSGKFLSSQYWKDFSICFASDRLTTTAPTTITSAQSESAVSAFKSGADARRLKLLTRVS